MLSVAGREIQAWRTEEEAAPSPKYLGVPRPSSNYNETLLSLAMLREIL